MFKRKRKLGKIKITTSFFTDLEKGRVYDYYREGSKLWVVTDLGHDFDVVHPATSEIIKYEILK
ncbi:hypothetical protein PHYNN_131 [Pantoea phage Phynn]|nr:hypothetical protein PHYNN_131 [Pantoea phage Phynn]